MKKIVYFFVIFLMQATLSSAHRIDVFCYVEEGYIKCSSKFSTGSPVVKGTYKVFAKDKLIFEGKGDKEGHFKYKIPEEILKNPVDLKIVCRAEMGHKNFWIVKKEEYSNIEETKKEDSDLMEEDDDTFFSEEENQGKATCSINYNKIRDIIENSVQKTVEKELAPIRFDIAKLSTPKVDFRDILGGIGYILGIMGIILYFKRS